MPYVLKKFEAIKGKKIEDFLENEVGLNNNLAQKLLAKGKILNQNKKRLQKGESLKSGFIEILIFEPITKGLKPIFQTEHFAIFDKPSGIMVHPTTNSKEYTLLDEIKYYFGEKASLVHRIDQETSGLVLVSKNEYSEMILKSMFEKKLYKKTYQALVENKIEQEITIDNPITNDDGKINIKMKTDINGKDSTTIIKPIFFNKEKNQTLVVAIPLTGRQHQIRVHLNSIGHRIIGDPIYGINENDSDLFLRKKLTNEERISLTGNKRLMLQAQCLEFEYMGIQYKFFSKQKFTMD